LKDSRSKAAAVASGSWFHNRIVDGKKDSFTLMEKEEEEEDINAATVAFYSLIC
jgi:hypothetical protein